MWRYIKTWKFYTTIVFTLVFHGVHAQVSGCTDPLANNYNATATINDGSCTYADATVSPTSSSIISDSLAETSGLINWNSALWTHNDNDTRLYELDTTNGGIVQSCDLASVTSVDWEDLAQDSDFIYIGDFGNNSNGNRQDLRILRIAKDTNCFSSSTIDTIAFYYSDQLDFSSTGPNNTNFDCEAFIVTDDSIYLFTKQWISQQSNVYALPKTPGVHTANLRYGFNVQGLITGASYLDENSLLVLCGYSTLLQPFLYLLYDFNNTQFFSGNKRKINLNLSFHQIEAITTNDGLNYYLTNEYFNNVVIIEQKLHKLNMSSYLESYLNTSIATVHPTTHPTFVYPNPFNDNVTIKVGDKTTANGLVGSSYVLTNVLGRVVASGLIPNNLSINLEPLHKGLYFLHLPDLTIHKLLKN